MQVFTTKITQIYYELDHFLEAPKKFDHPRHKEKEHNIIRQQEEISVK